MRLILLLFILGALALGIGRASGQGFEYEKADAKLFYFWDGSDTLTDADTLAVEYPKVLEGRDWVFYCSMTADSLDGSPAGTAYLQASYRYDPEAWINLDSLVFNGAGTYTTHYTNTADGAFMPLKIRLYAITSGTCTVKLTDAWILLKR